MRAKKKKEMKFEKGDLYRTSPESDWFPRNQNKIAFLLKKHSRFKNYYFFYFLHDPRINNFYDIVHFKKLT